MKLSDFFKDTDAVFIAPIDLTQDDIITIQVNAPLDDRVVEIHRKIYKRGHTEPEIIEKLLNPKK